MCTTTLDPFSPLRALLRFSRLTFSFPLARDGTTGVVRRVYRPYWRFAARFAVFAFREPAASLVFFQIAGAAAQVDSMASINMGAMGFTTVMFEIISFDLLTQKIDCTTDLTTMDGSVQPFLN